jgi:hypothetical protein
MTWTACKVVNIGVGPASERDDKRGEYHSYDWVSP